MHYVDEGSGETLLFLHGLPSWSFCFRKAIQDLSTEFRCVALDHIGFGLSDKPKDFDQKPYWHCRNVGQLVEHLDLSDITLVAHDFGGPIGLSYLLENPGRFKRIVLMNTWIGDLRHDPTVEKLVKVAQGALGKFLYVQTDLAPKHLKSQFHARSLWTEAIQKAYFGPFEDKDARYGPWALTRQLLEASAWFDDIWSNRDQLSEIPLLLLWGMQDPTFGERHLNRIWHEFPLAEVRTFDDAGHYVMEEKPAETTQRLREFCRGVLP